MTANVDLNEKMARLQAQADGKDVPPKPAPQPKSDEPTVAWLQAETKKWAKLKGWEDDRGVGDLMMLMVTELAEAYEEYRDWHEPGEVYVKDGKPEGIPVELADVVIRILVFCGKYDIDLQAVILQKMAFNNTREHRHGGKRV